METGNADSTQPVAVYIIAATTFHLLVYYSFGEKISVWAFPKAFNSLNRNEKIYWVGSLPSSVNGVVVGTIGLIILYQGQLKSDPIWGSTWLSVLYASLGMGYFIADIWIMVNNYDILGSPTVIVHHFIVVVGYIMILGWQLVGYFVALRSLSELTQPFTFVRWALAATGKRHDNIYIYNGLVFTLLFFMTRIFIMPYYYSSVYSVLGTDDFYRMNLFCKCTFLSSTVALDVLNAYWFVKIIKGCVKVLGPKISKRIK